MFTHYPRWRGGGDYRRARAIPTGTYMQRVRRPFTPRTAVDVYASEEWQKDTVDGHERYWLRFRPSSAMTSTTISAVYVNPYRPPIDPALFPQSGAAIAKVLPKILVGTWAGERIIWHDVWTLEASRIMKLLIGRTSGPNSVGHLSLFAICGDDIYQMPIGPEADPVRAAYPPTERGPHELECSSIDFDQPARVLQLIVHTKFLQEEDALWVYTRWDNSAGWEKAGPFAQTPAIVGGAEGIPGQGRILHVAFQLNDATRDATPPYIDKIEIPSREKGGWTPIEDEPMEPQIESPQRS